MLSKPIATAYRSRLLASYDFEGGGNVELRVTGDVDTNEALDTIEIMIGLKRKEIADRMTSETV